MSWREGSSPPTMWQAIRTTLCRALRLPAVLFPNEFQDSLHSAGVEGSEDAGAHSKLPQPSQKEEALMCLLQHCICVNRPCEILGDVNAVCSRRTSVEDQRRWGIVAHSDHLASACQEVQDPAAQRSVQSQSLELCNQCGRHYGVKCWTIIHNQHPHIGVLIFQVGESSVQCEDNSIVCGTITAVCKL